jgi:hypothetical protein
MLVQLVNQVITSHNHNLNHVYYALLVDIPLPMLPPIVQCVTQGFMEAKKEPVYVRFALLICSLQTMDHPLALVVLLLYLLIEHRVGRITVLQERNLLVDFLMNVCHAPSVIFQE